MAKKNTGKSLIDWNEPEANAHLLDWRERAHRFGLVPVEAGEPGEQSTLVLPVDRLLEEDPEADSEQELDESDSGRADEETQSAGEAALPDHELDLVRLYLSHIAQRRLLSASEEQDIGRRIEVARGNLLAALVSIPCARQTLLALADTVRPGAAPAAELILLPDGGELKPEKVQPVLAVLDGIRTLADDEIRSEIRDLLIRPSVHRRDGSCAPRVARRIRAARATVRHCWDPCCRTQSRRSEPRVPPSIRSSYDSRRRPY
jgi:hypothetical protein